MSNMIIKITDVEQQTAKNKAGKSYNLLEVSYKNVSFDNKPEIKKHNQYGNKEVFETLKNAVKGDVFTITREKDDAGYWQWVGITQGENATPAPTTAPSKATPAPKSTYETPEERAKKQVYIVRQSSVNAAIEFLNHNNKNYKLGDIIDTAKVFEGYVFGTDLAVDSDELPEMDDDDIPL